MICMQDLADSLHTAAGCRREKACLAGQRPMCRAVDANGRNILFLAGGKPRSCPYRTNFGGIQICRCPVYFETFTGRGQPHVQYR